MKEFFRRIQNVLADIFGFDWWLSCCECGGDFWHYFEFSICGECSHWNPHMSFTVLEIVHEKLSRGRGPKADLGGRSKASKQLCDKSKSKVHCMCWHRDKCCCACGEYNEYEGWE